MRRNTETQLPERTPVLKRSVRTGLSRGLIAWMLGLLGLAVLAGCVLFQERPAPRDGRLYSSPGMDPLEPGSSRTGPATVPGFLREGQVKVSPPS